MRYLWRLRVKHALEMLRSTGLSLGEIADRTGFRSVYHLSRMIKRLTGQTPTELRNWAWGGPVHVLQQESQGNRESDS